MNAIFDAGLDIPKDIAMIGAGNLHFNSSLRVPLSSVDQQSAKLGEQAGELILDILDPKKNNGVHRVILEPSVVVRASTKID